MQDDVIILFMIRHRKFPVQVGSVRILHAWLALVRMPYQPWHQASQRYSWDRVESWFDLSKFAVDLGLTLRN